LTLPLVLAPEAEDDLLDAADWYDAQQPGLGIMAKCWAITGFSKSSYSMSLRLESR
jgi:hypothetical protein